MTLKDNNKELREQITQEVSNSVIEMAEAYNSGDKSYDWEPMVNSLVALITSREKQLMREARIDELLTYDVEIRKGKNWAKYIEERLAELIGETE